MDTACGLHIIVVGCGAIGSFLIPLLARFPRVSAATLIDPDRYDESNLSTQNILRSDVNEYKVAVQARRLRTANPRLAVVAIPSDVAAVPLGALRADLLLSCVDSKRARQTVNEVACRWRIPWVDSGLLNSEGLARVSVYMMGEQDPCMECAWDERDYAILEQEYPCGATLDVGHSDVSAALASLAATLQAIECQKLIDGDPEHDRSRQLTVDVHSHRMLSTVFRRNPACRFDHAAWNPMPFRCSLQRTSLVDLLATTGCARVSSHRFATRLVCPRCGFRFEGLRLDRPKLPCPNCKMRMVPPDFSALFDQVDGSLPLTLLSRSLAQVGILPWDVISGMEKQFEIVPEVL